MLLASKLIERVPDPRNAKEHYESLFRKKNRKLVKQSEIITYQPKTFKNASIVDLFFYSSPKAEITINESGNDDVFKSIYTTIITNIKNL